MDQPSGFLDPNVPSHVCKLHKSLYGLKQAPHAWFTCLSNHLLDLGFNGPKVILLSSFGIMDNTLYIFILIYVVDIVLVGSHQADVIG